MTSGGGDLATATTVPGLTSPGARAAARPTRRHHKAQSCGPGGQHPEACPLAGSPPLSLSVCVSLCGGGWAGRGFWPAGSNSKQAAGSAGGARTGSWDGGGRICHRSSLCAWLRHALHRQACGQSIQPGWAGGGGRRRPGGCSERTVPECMDGAGQPSRVRGSGAAPSRLCEFHVGLLHPGLGPICSILT